MSASDAAGRSSSGMLQKPSATQSTLRLARASQAAELPFGSTFHFARFTLSYRGKNYFACSPEEFCEYFLRVCLGILH